MAQPYIGEIRMFGGNFAPLGWMMCEGQLVAISEYETLFNLIGTTYGGDGQTTFALPDLRGRLPIHQGNSFVMGQSGGTETETLTSQQIPVHTHPLVVSGDAAARNSPSGSVPGSPTSISPYRAGAPASPLAAQALQATGGSQPHDNMQPYLCVTFIISMSGIYPTPN